jgi:aminoglycoside 3-N-acetyltransferase I
MTTGTINIRHLARSDVALLREVNAMFGEAFSEPETYGGDPPDDAYLEGLLAKEHVVALAALAGDEVVGGLVAYDLPKFERARRELYIYDLAVAEPHRRRGVATALIEALRGIAAARGAWVIYVQADYGDEPAIALYEKLGRREDVMHFDIDVRSDTGGGASGA